MSGRTLADRILKLRHANPATISTPAVDTSSKTLSTVLKNEENSPAIVESSVIDILKERKIKGKKLISDINQSNVPPSFSRKVSDWHARNNKAGDNLPETPSCSETRSNCNENVSLRSNKKRKTSILTDKTDTIQIDRRESIRTDSTQYCPRGRIVYDDSSTPSKRSKASTNSLSLAEKIKLKSHKINNDCLQSHANESEQASNGLSNETNGKNVPIESSPESKDNHDKSRKNEASSESADKNKHIVASVFEKKDCSIHVDEQNSLQDHNDMNTELSLKNEIGETQKSQDNLKEDNTEKNINACKHDTGDVPKCESKTEAPEKSNVANLKTDRSDSKVHVIEKEKSLVQDGINGVDTVDLRADQKDIQNILASNELASQNYKETECKVQNSHELNSNDDPEEVDEKPVTNKNCFSTENLASKTSKQETQQDEQNKENTSVICKESVENSKYSKELNTPLSSTFDRLEDDTKTKNAPASDLQRVHDEMKNIMNSNESTVASMTEAHDNDSSDESTPNKGSAKIIDAEKSEMQSEDSTKKSYDNFKNQSDKSVEEETEKINQIALKEDPEVCSTTMQSDTNTDKTEIPIRPKSSNSGSNAEYLKVINETHIYHKPSLSKKEKSAISIKEEHAFKESPKITEQPFETETHKEDTNKIFNVTPNSSILLTGDNGEKEKHYGHQLPSKILHEKSENKLQLDAKANATKILDKSECSITDNWEDKNQNNTSSETDVTRAMTEARRHSSAKSEKRLKHVTKVSITAKNATEKDVDCQQTENMHQNGETVEICKQIVDDMAEDVVNNTDNISKTKTKYEVSGQGSVRNTHDTSKNILNNNKHEVEMLEGYQEENKTKTVTPNEIEQSNNEPRNKKLTDTNIKGTPAVTITNTFVDKGSEESVANSKRNHANVESSSKTNDKNMKSNKNLFAEKHVKFSENSSNSIKRSFVYSSQDIIKLKEDEVIQTSTIPLPEKEQPVIKTPDIQQPEPERKKEPYIQLPAPEQNEKPNIQQPALEQKVKQTEKPIDNIDLKKQSAKVEEKGNEKQRSERKKNNKEFEALIRAYVKNIEEERKYSEEVVNAIGKWKETVVIDNDQGYTIDSYITSHENQNVASVSSGRSKRSRISRRHQIGETSDNKNLQEMSNNEENTTNSTSGITKTQVNNESLTNENSQLKNKDNDQNNCVPEHKSERDKSASERKSNEDEHVVERNSDQDKSAAERKSDEDEHVVERNSDQDKSAAERKSDEYEHVVERNSDQDKAAVERNSDENEHVVERNSDQDKSAAEWNSDKDKAAVERNSDEIEHVVEQRKSDQTEYTENSDNNLESRVPEASLDDISPPIITNSQNKNLSSHKVLLSKLSVENNISEASGNGKLKNTDINSQHNTKVEHSSENGETLGDMENENPDNNQTKNNQELTSASQTENIRDSPNTISTENSNAGLEEKSFTPRKVGESEKCATNKSQNRPKSNTLISNEWEDLPRLSRTKRNFTRLHHIPKHVEKGKTFKNDTEYRFGDGTLLFQENEKIKQKSRVDEILMDLYLAQKRDFTANKRDRLSYQYFDTNIGFARSSTKVSSKEFLYERQSTFDCTFGETIKRLDLTKQRENTFFHPSRRPCRKLKAYANLQKKLSYVIRQ